MRTTDTDRVQEAFRRFLQRRRIRSTAARREILSAVLEFDGHFESETVYDKLKERNSSVGKATVYRTLPLLVECGVLKQVRFDTRRTFYEVCFGAEPHDHMVCRRCGGVTEFSSAALVALRTQIAREHHFHVTSHRFQLHGLCWDCVSACPVADASRQTKPARRHAR